MEKQSPLELNKKGQYVIGNMHFDTTMAHIGLASGRPVNFVTVLEDSLQLCQIKLVIVELISA